MYKLTEEMRAAIAEEIDNKLAVRLYRYATLAEVQTMLAPKKADFNCELCGKPILTRVAGQTLHDGCWELKTRIEYDPKLALEILKQMFLK